MVRLLTLSLLAAAILPAAAETPERGELQTGFDLSYIDVSGLDSFMNGSIGKLRYDDSNDGIQISRAFLDWSIKATDTLDMHLALEAYDDDAGAIADLTEAYFEWRPVPASANRYRLRLGAFYPKMSFENVGPAWGSPYSISYSAINTWIAEELRTVGAELSWSRRPALLGGTHTLGLQAALIVANDPTGAFVAWKGWSVHDRQTRLISDELPLRPMPQIGPGGAFEEQDQYLAPFRETDGRVGYYVNGEWRMGSRLSLRLMHYDNRADPAAVKDGQYAWETTFDHLGAQVALPWDLGLIAQWIRGTTIIGDEIINGEVMERDFASQFVMLTRAFDAHRVAVRYDRFEVTRDDDAPDAVDPDSGFAWTVNYQYDVAANLNLAIEWLRIESSHWSWMFSGIDTTQTEEQLQISARFRFGGHRAN